MTKTLKVTWAKRLAAATVVAASMAAPAAAFVDGCPSGQIMAGFSEFGKTGKMDPVMGKWLGDVGAQRIESSRLTMWITLACAGCPLGLCTQMMGLSSLIRFTVHSWIRWLWTSRQVVQIWLTSNTS